MSEKNGTTPKALGVAGAAKYLGVSHYKITRFIKLGLLQAHKDLNDERQKLIKITDLDRLKRQLESPVGDSDGEGRELNSAAA
jgi:DNA-binding MarR family transcriptional regulator